jgi:hypothetical protein
MIVGSSFMLSSGISMLTGCPTASAAVYPYSRSAPAFQLVMMPSSDLPMIASADDRTIAARSSSTRSCA